MKLAETERISPGRIFFIWTLVGISFVFVLAGYYRLQILNQERYEALGEKYRIKKRRVKATRGLIYDRNQKLITENRPTYNLVLLRNEMKKPWSKFQPEISEFSGLAPELLNEQYKKFRAQYLSLPIILEKEIDFPQVLRILRNQLRYPGLSVETTTRRHYSDNQLFAHVLGYVGEASRAKLKQNPNLRLGDAVGKRGLERFYNDILTGVDGERTILVDNQGVFQSNEITTPANPGDDLYLTLDSELQELAASQLGDQKGCVVLMDVQTGGLLVYYSSPSFNLNQFTRRLTHEQWEALRSADDNPLLNRPLQGTYAPGSIFKLVTLLAALRKGTISYHTKYYCGGKLRFLNRDFHCHNEGGHGTVDLNKAIQKSCNVFFYNVGRDLGATALAETAVDLGLGQKTGVDLIGEQPGRVSSPQWKRRYYNKPWYPGETLSLAIGQGDLLTTPVQIVQLMAYIANEGFAPEPHFLYKSKGRDGESITQPVIRRVKDFPVEYFKALKTAMWKVVNDPNGTGRRAKVKGLDICGKTATSQLSTFKTDAERREEANRNAWFSGFAPKENPKVAIVVLVERVKGGGYNAAPVARQILDAYFRAQSEMDPI